MKRLVKEELTETIDNWDIKVTKETVEGPHIIEQPRIQMSRGLGVSGLYFLGDCHETAKTFRRIADWLESVA